MAQRHCLFMLFKHLPKSYSNIENKIIVVYMIFYLVLSIYFAIFVQQRDQDFPSIILQEKQDFLGYHCDCESSNNYNMKSVNNKNHQALELLYQLNLLRQDCLLFSKIAILQADKKARSHYHTELTKLYSQRQYIQKKVELFLSGAELNQYWRGAIFSFNNKIYKQIKAFYQKIHTFSQKLSEIFDTNSLLQSLRILSIQKLGQCNTIGQYITLLLDKLRERQCKQSSFLNFVGIHSKAVQLARKEQILKNHRYQCLSRDKQSVFFLNAHTKVLKKLEIQIDKLLGKNSNMLIKRSLQFYGLDIDQEEDEVNNNQYIMQNGISVNLNYRQEGFCQFISAKYGRIIKDLLSKNRYNQRVINKFRQKYQENIQKNQISSAFQKQSKFVQKIKQKRQSTKSVPINLSTSLQMISLPKLETNDIFLDENIETLQQKKPNFKIQKFEAKKKSYTLRPLGQSKQCNKQVIHQKLIEMKLQQEPIQLGKILRIRKRKHFPILKDEHGWSLMIKQNRSKVSFLIQ